jgi:hypothetical protein
MGAFVFSETPFYLQAQFFRGIVFEHEFWNEWFVPASLQHVCLDTMLASAQIC